MYAMVAVMDIQGAGTSHTDFGIGTRQEVEVPKSGVDGKYTRN
jgi:hypothetical protein